MRSNTVWLAIAALSLSTVNAAPDCGSNITAAGNDWAVTCDYILEAKAEQLMGGDPDMTSCLEACVAAQDCYGVNFPPNGSCILASGEAQGARAETGYSNLLRLSEPTASVPSTSETPTASSTATFVGSITSTIYGPDATPTSLVSVTTTSSSLAIASSTAAPTLNSSQLCSVDLDLDDICPTCDGLLTEVDDKYYLIACDSELQKPTNGTYLPQERLTPGGCLEQCNSLAFCQGASYFDYEDCEIAKGPAAATARPSYTAFIPVAAATARPSYTAFIPVAAPTAAQPSSVVNPSSTSTVEPLSTAQVSLSATAEPTFSILPVPNQCDQSSPSCPGCNGIPVQDKLNSSYTIACMQPVCDSTVHAPNAKSHEACMESCDQDVTCLAAVWAPSNSTCRLCQQGLESSNSTRGDLSYVVFVAEQNNEAASTSTSTIAVSAGSSITAFQTPFPDDAGTGSAAAAKLGKPVISGYGPGKPTVNLTTAASLIPPTPISTDAPVDNTTSSAPSASNIGYSNMTSASSPPVSIVSSGAILPSTTPTPNTGFNPGGPITNATSTSNVLTSTTSQVPHITNIPPITCPNYDGDVYIDDDGDFFEVMCDSIFIAAHSQYVSASDLPACIASCTNQCDGAQFLSSTRCGLYTSIDSVASASGWTIAAKIELPTSVPASTTSSSYPSGSVVSAGTGSLPAATNSGVLPPFTNATGY